MPTQYTAHHRCHVAADGDRVRREPWHPVILTAERHQVGLSPRVER
jgi:hypothetical protein